MARNIGYYFLRGGHRVSWMSGDLNQLESLKKWHTTMKRRLAGLKKPVHEAGSNMFLLPGDPKPGNFDIIIESTRENLVEKQKIVRQLEHLYSDQTILVSNSSSILPQSIHPWCMGLHFFYPVELTGIVELIVSSNHSERLVSELIKILKDNKLGVVRETRKSAFLINRLLLPIQSESFGSLKTGYDPKLVDRSTMNELLPMGQLGMMDSIGLDVLHMSVGNFVNRMDGASSTQYADLLDGLDMLCKLGKRGRKNKNGLLSGSALPWQINKSPADKFEDLVKKNLYLFINTCYYAIERDEVAPGDLEAIQEAVFSPNVPLFEVVKKIKPKTICKNLEKWYKRTKRDYFFPAAPLQ